MQIVRTFTRFGIVANLLFSWFDSEGFSQRPGSIGKQRRTININVLFVTTAEEIHVGFQVRLLARHLLIKPRFKFFFANFTYDVLAGAKY